MVREKLATHSRAHRKACQAWSTYLANFLMSSTEELGGSAEQVYPHLTSRQVNRTLLRDPETFAACTIFASQVFAKLFGDDEFVRTVGGTGDEHAVAVNTKAIRAQFRAPGNVHTMWKAVLDSVIYGVGWVENPVETVNRMSLGALTKPTGGGPITDFGPKMTKYVNPVWRNLDIFSFVPDWSSNFNAEMAYGIKCGNLTASHFRAFVGALGEKADKSALERALKNNCKEWSEGVDGKTWRDAAISPYRTSDFEKPAHSRPIQFYEFRGEDDRQPIDSIERYRCIIVANNEVVFDAPHPYYKHPYRSINVGVFNGRPYGISPAEVGRYEQDALDTIRILEMEAAVDTVRTPKFANRSVIDDMSLLQGAPSGAWVPVDGNPAVAAAVFPNNTAVNIVALQNISAKKQFYRQGVGVPDVMQGIAAGSRTTAREIAEISQSANVPLDVKVDLIENEDLPALARDVGQRLILALRDEDDPDAALTARLGMPCKLSDLLNDLSIEFIGSARYAAKMGQGAAIERAANLAIAMGPAAQNLVNLPRLLVKLFQAGDPVLAEEILNDPMQAIGQGMFAQAMAGGAPQKGAPSPPRAQPPMIGG